MGVGIFLVYLIPPTLLFLPLSRLVTQLGLKDSLWALILVYPSFTVPFATWLLMGFFKTIPPELEEAAMMDGASRLKALYLIILPISVPGILTVVIFAFSLCVNEFIYAFTFISSSEQRTVSAGIPNDLIRGDVFFWQSLMAATLIPAIPHRAALQRFPRPVHQRVYRRGIPLENRGPKGGTRGRRSRRRGRCRPGTDPRRPAQARHRGNLRDRDVRRALRPRPRGLRAPQVRPQAALGRAQDHDLGAFRPGLRHVARRDVRQAVGRGERRRGQGRPHQQRPAEQHGGVRGRRPERSRPVLVHLAPRGVPAAGDPRDRPRPGGLEEARAR